MKVVFFGTPEFSAAALDYLIKAGVDVVGVISKPDKPKGRSRLLQPTPVKELIESDYPHIPLHQPEKVSDPDFFPVLEAFEADFFVVVAYGEIIKEALLALPKIACINLHTSLLPKLRGAAPIQRAIINGDLESGSTIMHMVKKMDAGDIITQTIIEILPDMTYGELEQSLLSVGKVDLLKALNDLESNQATRTSQVAQEMTLAPKVELEECEVIWSEPAQVLHNLIRGVNPEPGAWCWATLKGEKKRLKLYLSRLSDLAGNPGEIISWGKAGLVVGCGEKSLELLEVQLEGKKRMSAKELMLGYSKDSFSL